MELSQTEKRKYIIATGLSVLSVTAFCFFVFPSTSHAYTFEPLYKVLQTNDNIKDVWKNVRNIINVIIIAVLIFIAFANILRINLNNYAIKKFLPALIAGVILANFSYFICQLLVDLANVAMSLLMNGATGASASNYVGSGKVGVAGAFDFTAMKIDVTNLWKTFIYVMAEFVGAAVIFILAFLFLIRNYVIYFLVALSPLAFMATVLPETKTVFKQWMSMFTKWTFMPIISLFWLWLGGMWYSSGFQPAEAGGDFNTYLLAIVFAIVCYILAITTPFKMGGAIMSGWGNAGKKVWGATGGKAAKWAGNEIKDRAIDTGLRTSNAARRLPGIKQIDKLVQNQRKKNWSAKAIRDLRREGPGMVREKMQKDARLDAANYFLRHRGSVPEAQLKRYRSQLLADAKEEAKTTHENTPVSNLKHWLETNDLTKARTKSWTDGGGGQDVFSRLEALRKRANMSNPVISQEAKDALADLQGRFEAAGLVPQNPDGTYKSLVDLHPSGWDDLGTSDVVEHAQEALTPEGVALAREVAAGRQTSETTINRESLEAMAEVIQEKREDLRQDVEHDTTVAATVMERLSVVGSSHSGNENDRVLETMAHMKEMKDQSALGLDLLSDTNSNTRASSIAAAVDAAKSISGTFETSLRAHEDDPEKMAEELGRIFNSTQKEIARIEASDLGEEIAKYQQDATAWKQERTQSEMQIAPQMAEISALNEVFASKLPQMENTTFDDLRVTLDKHLDTLIQSNEALQDAIRDNPSGVNLGSVKSELTNAVNASIGQQMKNSTAISGDPTSRIRESMVSALTDSKVNKTLASTFQRASETALKSAPNPVIDIKPPSAPGGSGV